MSMFTPGPWNAHEGAEITSGDEDRHIATAWNNDKVTPDEALANARLIAAAPDLLNVCQEAFHYVSEHEGLIHDQICAVLAQALGED